MFIISVLILDWARLLLITYLHSLLWIPEILGCFFRPAKRLCRVSSDLLKIFCGSRLARPCGFLAVFSDQLSDYAAN
jgi:hypothetical protein